MENLTNENSLFNNSDVVNSLKCSIDWLEFTVTEISSISVLLPSLGFSILDFNELAHGGMGYKQMLRHSLYEIIIMYDGNENMGIHVQVKGSAVMFALKSYIDSIMEDTVFGPAVEIDFKYNSFFPLFIQHILNIGHFTRIDLAVDDIGARYYTTDDVISLLQNGCCVSKFKSYQFTSKYNISSLENEGTTVYFGSRSSDILIRLYDKGKEKKVDIPWYRWECEIKHDKADVVAKKILDDTGFGSTAIGVISNYIRFVVNDNSNRSRCSLQPKWQKFIMAVEKCSLTVPKSFITVKDKEEWIKKQCMPTIAGLVKFYDGDMSFIYQHLLEHYDRLSHSQKKLFEGDIPYV